MTTINEVSKTGMAIDQARGIIDKTMPQVQDLVPEYEYAKRMPLYADTSLSRGI